MSTAPGRRRKRRPPPGRRGPDPGWEMQHSPYTVEGEIEGFSRLTDGGAGRPRRLGGRRLVAAVILVAMAAPFVLAVTAVILRG